MGFGVGGEQLEILKGFHRAHQSNHFSRTFGILQLAAFDLHKEVILFGNLIGIFLVDPHIFKPYL